MCVTPCFWYLCMKIVIMDIRTFKNSIEKFLQGKTTEKDKNILQQFENKMVERNISKVFHSQEQSEAIEKEISANVFNVIQKPVFLWKRVVVAASMLILVGTALLFFFLRNNSSKITEQNIVIQEVTMKTKENEQRQITLEDGTKITLYGESSLTYPKKFSENIRKVSLSGEAFFEVARNEKKPFVVHSQNIETKVLGTSFNIKAYENQEDIKVTLVSGKVNVCAENQQVTLSPSQQVIYNKVSEVMTSKNIDLQLFTEMKNGILRFEEASLEDFAEKLEDFYNIKVLVKVKNIKKYQITGVFNKEKLNVVLQQMLFIHRNLSVEKLSKNQVVIKEINH